ncbi:Very long-chain acyl-CoA synthetase [Varanus komodoensis]|nr:Very long-chain acyl-CoA synthetase [Varanus komodoensis]
MVTGLRGFWKVLARFAKEEYINGPERSLLHTVCPAPPGRWATLQIAAMLTPFTAVLGLLVLLPLLGNIYFPYLWLDLVFFFSLMRAHYRISKYLQRKPPFTMLDIFLAKVQKHPEKPFILFEEETYSYRDIDQRSSQVARVFRGHLGLKGGETVAVFLKNTPAYIWVWLGLEKIGCVMACVNYNIRSVSLLHVVNTCEAKVLVTTSDLKAAIEEVMPSLQSKGIRVFYLDDDSPTEGVEALLGRIRASSTEPVPPSFRTSMGALSTALYVFTSGTTGLPKAAVITQKKLISIASFFCLSGLHAGDIVYTPLPLYHTAALLLGIGGCLEVGATCVLRSKFSVSHFWDDCRRYRVSVIQYVGEVMSYLCNAPKKDNDRDHSVRLAVGNGMRMEVWKEFLRRFGPIQIYEFYGATEGNVGFVNYTGKVGAVGRASYFFKKLANFELIKYDVIQNEPIRNKEGRCIPVATEGSLVLNGATLPLRDKVRSLGVLLDPELSLEAQVTAVARSAFLQLRLINQLRPYLEYDCLATVTHALVTSHLDFCNALYVGLPLKTVRTLQLVQNRAARLLTGTGRYAHMTPVLRQLHWLPIEARAQFKVLIMTYKALNGLGPGYLNERLRETGLLVSKITKLNPFSGYTEDRQTSEKILRDVFEKGDCFFNSGDLLMQDDEGFLYFRDRVGDTFRWKGENVATTEVETLLAKLEFIQEVNVYGVVVPGHEGKVGMAAIKLKEGLSFDGKKLYAHAQRYLPKYAIPHFVRIRDALEITGTFKQRKVQLVKEGFDPAAISDPLYFLDASEKCYVPMTQQIYSSILEKKLKL